MKDGKSYYTPVKPEAVRILAVFLLLEKRQIVNYDRIYLMYEISYNTFMRIIYSIREVLNNNEVPYKATLIFNRRRNTYELIKF